MLTRNTAVASHSQVIVVARFCRRQALPEREDIGMHAGRFQLVHESGWVFNVLEPFISEARDSGPSCRYRQSSAGEQ